VNELNGLEILEMKEIEIDDLNEGYHLGKSYLITYLALKV
jgi:hypothetical protein